jgi:hypothetical protein
MSGENLINPVFDPLFDGVLNHEKFDSKSCEQGKQWPSFLHDYNLCYLHFATWRYLFALVLTSRHLGVRFRKVKCQISLEKPHEPAKKFPQKVSEDKSDSLNLFRESFPLAEKSLKNFRLALTDDVAVHSREISGSF